MAPPHHPYEAKIYNTVAGILTELQTILIKLQQNPNDGNLSPTKGMIDRLTALLKELKNGSPNQTTHDKNIEGILYATAQIADQYSIWGQSPATQAHPKPTGGTHEERVLRLFTTIDSICRDIFHILEPGTLLTAQPTGGTGNTHKIKVMASDTLMVIQMIRQHIVTIHILTNVSK
jgi:hypothetical protein